MLAFTVRLLPPCLLALSLFRFPFRLESGLLPLGLLSLLLVRLPLGPPAGLELGLEPRLMGRPPLDLLAGLPAGLQRLPLLLFQLGLEFPNSLGLLFGGALGFPLLPLEGLDSSLPLEIASPIGHLPIGGLELLLMPSPQLNEAPSLPIRLLAGASDVIFGGAGLHLLLRMELRQELRLHLRLQFLVLADLQLRERPGPFVRRGFSPARLHPLSSPVDGGRPRARPAILGSGVLARPHLALCLETARRIHGHPVSRGIVCVLELVLDDEHVERALQWDVNEIKGHGSLDARLDVDLHAVETHDVTQRLPKA